MYSGVESILEIFAKGQMVIVTDDEDRENEGDLIVAASHCTPEQMAFIVRHTSGIVCAPIKASLARSLQLAPMVSANNAPLSTAFTVSVDVRKDLTTGISATERTNTVKALANANCTADDFVRPGHVFPLIAQEGGVLMRSGHTEAAVDLCELSGLPAVGVISELVNDDGTVMRGPQIQEFAKTHHLRILTIADLIAYKQVRERLVERVGEFEVQTSIGKLKAYAYQTPFDKVQHIALMHGSWPPASPTMVRFHREDVLNDVFAKGASLDQSLKAIQQEGQGVLIYLRDGAAGVQTHNSSQPTGEKQWREIGLGAQILKDMGISKIKLLSSPRNYVGLDGFGIEITETIQDF